MSDPDGLEDDGDVYGVWSWFQGGQDILNGLDAAGENRVSDPDGGCVRVGIYLAQWRLETKTVVSTAGLEGPMPISTPEGPVLGFIAMAFKGF